MAKYKYKYIGDDKRHVELLKKVVAPGNIYESDEEINNDDFELVSGQPENKPELKEEQKENK